MFQKVITLTILLSIPALLQAHGSHGSGIMAGFTHPILGVDHNIAILGAGFLGYVMDQKKWFLYALAFIIAMIVGGVLGVGNEATPLIEKTIAFSVLTIGLMIVFNDRLSMPIILLILAIFGGFHGYAHGAEMPESNTIMKYVPGFAMGAALIALIGTLLGRVVYSKAENSNAITLVGGIVIGCGIMMLLP